MVITYQKLQSYLDAIAKKGNLDATFSGHGIFWHIPYADFVTGFVPDKTCLGNQVPILNPDNKVDSAFFNILQAGWCGMPKMPKTGPFITNADYTVTLADGTEVSGQTMITDIHDWLAAGAPENGDTPAAS